MRRYKDAIHAIPADLHAGGTTALFPFGQVQLLTGGLYSASYLQGLIREQWVEYTDEIKNAREKHRLIVTFNGDLLDGDHHGTREVVSKTLKDQRDLASELIDEFLVAVNFEKKKGDSLYFTRGTPAHAGKIADEEEAIAEDFDATPWIPAGADKKARYLWPEVRLKINNTRFLVRHQGVGMSKRPHLSEGALYRYLRDRWTEHIMDDRKLYDWYVFSHYHQFMSTAFTVKGHDTIVNGAITPSWQMRTSYSHKFGELDSVGGIYFDIGENDCKLKTSIMEYEEVKDCVA